MKILLNAEKNKGKQAPPLSKMESYMTFRMAVPRPVTEDANVRHIMRFYIARTLSKSGYDNILVRPVVQANGKELEVDVGAEKGGKITLALCEPGSVTKETVAKLDTLKDAENAEVLIIYSTHASAGEVPQRFKEQLAAKKFRLMSIVPPPFDDAMEYDIWMFESTFRDVIG